MTPRAVNCNGRCDIAVKKELFYAHESGLYFLDEAGQGFIDDLEPFFRQHILIGQDGSVMDGNEPASFQFHQTVTADSRSPDRFRVLTWGLLDHNPFPYITNKPALVVPDAGPNPSLIPRQADLRWCTHPAHRRVHQSCRSFSVLFCILTGNGNGIVRNQGQFAHGNVDIVVSKGLFHSIIIFPERS